MVVSLVAVLLIGAIAWTGAAAGFQILFGMALPLLAVAVFLGGIIRKVLKWGESPVPFAIPTTGGQERSLDWIRPNRLDAPTSKAGVVGRMLLEVMLFRSLFRNTEAVVTPAGPRATYFSSKWLWAFALLFHYSFLVIFIRHFRFFIEPVPVCLTWIEFVDGIMQVGVPRLFSSDVVILVALGVLLARRLTNAKVRYVSLPNDYFPLFLLLGLVGSGILMRYFDRIDVAQAKVFVMGVLTFSPKGVEGLSPIFFVHLTFLSVLLMVFPFSKLMHMGGIFLSPTRNLPCNTRAVRHVNPWNVPTKYRTYAEYEDEFREAMAEAGLPLEKPLDDDDDAAALAPEAVPAPATAPAQ